jgi:hypothetical protein
LQQNGDSKFKITSGGTMTTSGSIVAGGNISIPTGANKFSWNNLTQLTCTADGNILIRNNASTDFGLMQYGGTTSSFPAWQRSSAGIIARLADNSANTTVTASTFISTATVRLKGYTVATLPTGVVGDIAYVTDASAPTYGAIVSGGGSVVTPVFFNGTNWTCR